MAFLFMEIKTTKAVEEFITSLEKFTIAKVLRVIDLLEKFGNQLKLPHSKSLGKGLFEGLFELRIRGNKEIRIFYAYHSNKVILLHGFIKKSQQIPQKEISIANSRLKDLGLG